MNCERCGERQVFLEVPRFGGRYRISQCGVVQSRAKRGPKGFGKYANHRTLKGCTLTTGYRIVHFCYPSGAGRRIKPILLHRLVAKLFLGCAPSPQHQVAHWDGDKSNNCVGNLRWASAAENSMDSIRLGRVSHGEQRYNAKLDPRKIADARARVEAGESIRSVAIHLGVAHRTLSNAIKGRTWSRSVSQPSGSLT